MERFFLTPVLYCLPSTAIRIMVVRIRKYTIYITVTVQVMEYGFVVLSPILFSQEPLVCSGKPPQQISSVLNG